MPLKEPLDDFDSPIIGRLSYFAKSPVAAAFGTEKNMAVEWVKTPGLVAAFYINMPLGFMDVHLPRNATKINYRY